ncbi:MAG: ChaN family lipoprotein [Ignavibacteriae bacterium]|nr:ChaN family lipoprotein [Ignavibacteriota bacterium]
MRNFVILICLILFSTTLLAERHYSIYDSKTGEKLTVSDLADRSLKFDIIFFGEFHDDSLLHLIQKELLTDMYSKNDEIAVSMEMFERDVQKYLDDYLNNKISEEEFLKNSRPWGDYKEFYKPLVELAKSHESPVIAANIPRKNAAVYTREGWTGIQKLPQEERGFVAKTLNIREDSYQAEFYKTMMQNMGMDSVTSLSPNEENTMYLYYGAQSLKDETMAESILNQYTKDEDIKIIHFNGDFHSNNYLGTVQKVIDRNKDVKIAVITAAYPDSGKALEYDTAYKSRCDYIIVLDEKQKLDITQAMMGGHLAQNYISNHKIELKIDPKNQSLYGVDEIKFFNPIAKKSSFKILKDLDINVTNAKNLGFDYEVKIAKDDSMYNEVTITSNGKEVTQVNVVYGGKIHYSPSVTLFNQKHSNTPGIISNEKDEGIYLPGGSCYPMTGKDLADFDFRIQVPKDFTIITSGKQSPVYETADNKIFQFNSELPLDDMILVGGRYIRKDTVYDGKTFSLYTFNPSPASDAYLNASIEYYKLYTPLLGPYPFSSFSIVENFFATGFGMPGYTLLSNKLMALPWIVLAPGSLAHEFVHNWWGNSIYVDYELGNWCEALTTFCSNYYYNVLTKKNDKAIDWRKKALLSLESLPANNNYPVMKFKYQSNNDDATIGYQKGGFIFYEIYKLIGEERFFTALKNFAKKYKGKRALWFSLMAAFDDVAKKDSLNIPVRKIMSQWLNELNIPTIKLENAKIDGDSLFLEISQDMNTTTSVPVKINTFNGEKLVNFTLTGKTNKFAFKPDSKVKSVFVDPDYQVLRHLNKWEIPFSFGRILAERPLMILPSKKSPDYNVSVKFADMVKESEYAIDYRSADEFVKDSSWMDRHLILLGDTKSNPFFKKFKSIYPESVSFKDTNITINNQKYSSNGNILLLNTSSPQNKDRLMTVIYCQNLESPEQFKRLFHYLSYSMVFLSKTKTGRPISDMEIFPNIDDKLELQYYFMCDK